MQSFVIALIQMQVGPDKDQNLQRAEDLVEKAAIAGARLVVLPEMFTCPYELERFHAFAEPMEGPAAAMLSRTAKRLGIHLVGGSFPEREGPAVYNTSTLWGPAGDRLLAHRKVHLFDIDIPGGITFQESKQLAAGETLDTADTDLGNIGLGICYDLRFPELFRSMAVVGAEILVLPGAFNTTTGPAHWEPLLRARAIENTCYVAACAPAPHPDGAYPSWGHSMVVSPYGEVLVRAEREETTLAATLDASRLAEVRKGLPVLAQRRPAVYARRGS